MKNWIVGVVVFALVLMSYSFYQLSGLKQYVKAVQKIDLLDSQDNQRAREEFYGTDLRGVQRGIFIGYGYERVWVWSNNFVKSFKVDKDSFYSWFDGCNDESRALLNSGKANVIKQVVYKDVQPWLEKVKMGDYVAVFPTQYDQGGQVGNLREVYAYNFWLFLGKGIDEECAK